MKAYTIYGKEYVPSELCELIENLIKQVKFLTNENKILANEVKYLREFSESLEEDVCDLNSDFINNIM